MKNNIKNTVIVTLLIAALGSATSCKKDSATPATTTTQTGVLGFHIHTMIDTTEADSGLVATDLTGRRFQLNVAQFYISNVKLKKLDGTYITVDNVYLLKTIAQEEYIVGNVPAGNYKSVSFDVGLDATTNSKNPSSFAASSPLSAQTPNMWFGSTSQGYMFMNIEGKADTSATNNGSVNQSFTYQLGTSSMLRTVNLPDNSFTITAGQTQQVHFYADYGKLLKGINFKTQSMGMPSMDPAVAVQVADSIPIMFRYE